MVVAPAELPGFCLIDGAALTPNGQRALATRPGEQTALQLPPPDQLIRYTPPGMALCMPLTHDRQPYGQPLYLRPSQQDRHLVVVGDTGSGKSVLMETGVLTNVSATDGPEILFDYKGGGTASEYLQMHFATYGSLENVYYFDLSRVLPAFSAFDISPLLEAGIPREEARSRKAGHYAEILQGLMGAEKYGEAAESVKAIRNHLRALYDPVHGEDAVSHADLYAALQRTQRGEGMPPTSDEKLAAYFTGLAERDRDVFNMILGGAVGRVETIATDGRLAPLFDHLPGDRANEAAGDEAETDSDATAASSSPAFDFTEIINEDAVVIFDFAGMEGKIKRALTLVILSNLWTALKARDRERGETHTEDLPQVNLYLEEARDIGATKLLDTLLSEGRSFGLSIALGLQFLEQLDSSRADTKTYQEALNETATFLVGNVTADTDLSRVLATDALSSDDIETRMATMGRGEWLVRPGTDFGEEAVRPFLARSLAAPPGHPVSEHPLSPSEKATFEQEFARLERETALRAGLAHERDVIASDDDDDDDGEDEPEQTEAVETELTGETPHPDLRVDTLLTHTRRMPECVSYDDQLDALHCETCSNRYDSDIAGMLRAIKCCHSLDDVDRDDIPVCDFNLKLSHNEILASDWSLQQLLFLQAVYNAQQRRYDPHEYNLQSDSMVRLHEYVGIEQEAVDELLAANLLHRDTDHPHRMYSVVADGRSAIVESYRQGLDFGHGAGDLNESTEHVFGVDIGVRLVEEHYQADPDSAVETVRPYHDLGEGELPAAAFMSDSDDAETASNRYEQRRLDVAGLDADGNVIVAVEVERVNHDVGRAVPEDYDKMAICEPEEAIWLVMSRSDGHKILETLNDPIDGEPRVEKTYSPNTPLQHFRIDTPGMTALYPVGYVRDSLLE
ncbi:MULTISPECIES: ATP-binding protein [Salinibaculum]|uniref:ATP-binding protein n=1 Tax=Salinibaculum TaxID=2732368 RepID=UPI0030CFC1B3